MLIPQGAQAIGDLGRNPQLEPILTMVIQLIGGLFLLIGFLTRWAAFACGALMLLLIIDGPPLHALYRHGEQLPFAPLMICIASYRLGGGKNSLAEKSKQKDG